MDLHGLQSDGAAFVFVAHQIFPAESKVSFPDDGRVDVHFQSPVVPYRDLFVAKFEDTALKARSTDPGSFRFVQHLHVREVESKRRGFLADELRNYPEDHLLLALEDSCKDKFVRRGRQVVRKAFVELVVLVAKFAADAFALKEFAALYL
jgi:hypothetical protein